MITGMFMLNTHTRTRTRAPQTAQWVTSQHHSDSCPWLPALCGLYASVICKHYIHPAVLSSMWKEIITFNTATHLSIWDCWPSVQWLLCESNGPAGWWKVLLFIGGFTGSHSWLNSNINNDWQHWWSVDGAVFSWHKPLLLPRLTWRHVAERIPATTVPQLRLWQPLIVQKHISACCLSILVWVFPFLMQ